MRVVPVPGANLILLIVSVFLAVRVLFVVDVLEGRPIDTVDRRKRGRQHQPNHMRGASAVGEVVVQDIRRIRPEIGPEKLGDLRPGQFVEVDFEFCLRITPGKVGVGIIESQPGQCIHDFRPAEGFGQENQVRMLGAEAAQAPFPERKRLGMRIIDSKNADAACDPEVEDAFQRFP